MSLKSPTLATTTDLVAWADRYDARGGLPRLVRRLVLASDAGIRQVTFRVDEGVDLGGWDGTTLADRADAFVPDGSTGWELTVRADTKRKADQGCADRLRNPAGLVPAQSTFVFVTLRRWRDKAEWASAQLAEGKWRDVRVLDACDLEAWLEATPAVHRWFSRSIGKQPSGSDDLESFWLAWSEATNPPLPPKLILAGREDIANAVAAWYEGEEAVLSVRTESPEEAVALLAAAVVSQPQPLRDACLSQTVVVRTREAWDDLCSASSSLVLVPRFDDAEAMVRARRAGHRVVAAARREPRVASADIQIPKLSPEAARAVFTNLGFDRERGWRLATLARRSLPALRRKLARDIADTPAWASSEAARMLVPLMLAGEWSDGNSADIAVLGTLAQVDTEQILRAALYWSRSTDPFLRRSGQSWYLASREDSWIVLSPELTARDLDRFRSVVLEVLGELDPRVDLPDDTRWMSVERPMHSESLRRGIAESLAAMGSRGGEQSVGGMTLPDWAARMLAELLARTNEDWRQWNSIALLLPLLAEAAPEIFLQAVEAGLSGQRPVMKLFRPERDPHFSSSDHIGLLWALETLAWSEDLLGRVALVLARLAEIDPGGRTMNRPRNSLRDIFLIWLPGTNAPWARRRVVLQTILDAAPEVGWLLCADILPRHSGSGSGKFIVRPVWREWGQKEPVRPARAAQVSAVADVVSMMLQRVGWSKERWATLISALPHLPREPHDQIVAVLETLDPTAFSEEDRSGVNDAVRHMVAQHRRFRKADWALPPEPINRLDRLRPRYELANPVYRFAWLFGAGVHLPDREDIDDWRDEEQPIAEARRDAVMETYRQVGAPGLQALVDRVKEPSILGGVAGASDVPDSDGVVLLRDNLAHQDPRRAAFAQAFVVERGNRYGREWAEEQFADATLSAAQRAEILVAMPRDQHTWQLAESIPEIDETYWRRVSPYVKRSSADVEYAARRLVRYDRAFGAAAFLSFHLRDDPPPDSVLITETLEAVLRQEKADAADSIVYHVCELLDHLARLGGIDETRLALLEFGFAELLRFDRPPTILHRALGTDPSLFTNLVTFIYRASGDEPSESTTNGEEIRADLAYQVLDSWSSLPGSLPDGSVDAAALTAWIDAALGGTTVAGRGDIGAERVGKALSTGPSGSDGAWPHETVRNQIQRLANALVDIGFRHGVYNSRGLVTKNPRDGGQQERELADQYGAWAKVVADRWPRMATVLRDIETDYRRDASREDAESDRRGDGIL